MTTNRTAKRMLLAQEIKHLMQLRDVDSVALAKAIKIRSQKMLDLLAGRATIEELQLDVLLDTLKVTEPGVREELIELWRDNHRRGYWTSGHRRAYSEDFRLMVDLERHADLIRSVESEMMPGNAQCEAYIRALFHARDDEDPDHTENFILARLDRQVVSLNEDMEYRVVMSESCLRRERGGPEVMREQIAHLLKLSKRPNVVFQVVPFNAHDVPSIEIRFIMLRVPSPGLSGPLDVAYIEGVSEFRYLEDPKAIADHETKWARLTSAALTPADTRKFFRHVEASYR